MKVIFGTTNKRKIEDLKSVCKYIGKDLEILGLDDINWDLGEIEENGQTIEENSLIKAQTIYDFCKIHNISYPIITDDSALFCEVLNGEPGIYTARYADDELIANPQLPKYQCIYKLLRKLNNNENRNAMYKCCVTLMLNDGTYYQKFGESKGFIADDIIGELKKPYFYAVFVLNGYSKAFSDLTEKELLATYRQEALAKILKLL